MRHRVKRAFTLVEILIVVVILGILAAIVVPQFTNASTEAQAGNCATQLQTIRSQIELYRVRHNGQYPDLINNGWTDLIGDDYMRAAPVNPRTNHEEVVAGTSHLDGSATDGWVFDAATGNLYASFFDEVAYADGDPATPAWTGP
jgi:general secretion pathway protein G